MISVEIIKNYGKRDGSEAFFIEVQPYRTWTVQGEPLVALFSNHDEAEEFYNIYQVQYFALCKSKEFNEDFTAAFFIGESGDLQCIIVSELPNNTGSGEEFLLFDYNAYLTIAEYTGESVLPIYNYIKSLRTGNIQPNSILINNKEHFNSTSQDYLAQRQNINN